MTRGTPLSSQVSKFSFKSEILFCMHQLLMFCNQKPNSAYFDHNNPLSMNCSQLRSAVLAPSWWRILDKLVGFCSYLRPEYGWGFVWGLLPGGSQGWTDGVLLYNANKLQPNVIHNPNRQFHQSWCASNGILMNEEELYLKTSVALATESSVYVWSRAPVVKLHKTLNNESGWYPVFLYCNFQGQKSLFYPWVYTCTL